jgi:hypothetical protein
MRRLLPGLLVVALAAAPAAAVAPAALRQADFFAVGAGPEPSLAQIAQTERPYDGVHSWDDYRGLLAELARPRYRVLTMAAFAAAPADPQRVVVGMRHDIDSHPEKALAMAALEEAAGLRSTYFVLHSASYYGEVRDGRLRRHAAIGALAQEFDRRGFEVGIHHDLFSMMWRHGFAPEPFLREELASYRALGVAVTGAAAHGDGTVIARGLNNMWIFAEFARSGVSVVEGRSYPYGQATLAGAGLAYEAYLLRRDESTGDIDARLKGQPATELTALLAAQPAGRRVIILTHPEHWGRTGATP